MEYYIFIGMLVLALGVLIGLFFTVHNPLKKIAERLMHIEDKLENIDKTLGGHSQKIEEHEKRLNGHDIEIEKLKK